MKLPSRFDISDIQRDPPELIEKPQATPAEFLTQIAVLSPKEMNHRLNVLGYRGQDTVRQSICLTAYRHIKRLRSIHIDNVPRNLLPPRANCILIGPTGVGKTYIVELLFGEILKLPYVIVEMTRFSETGYVGDNVSSILTRLFESAEKNVAIAECGIVALDEFDKIAGSSSNTRFAGEGTSKDVSGFGVQRELLKITEGADIQIPLDYGFSHFSSRSTISTRDITFFALGAFTGFKPSKNGSRPMGVLCEPQRKDDDKTIAYKLSKAEANNISQFQMYGFMPELIARFGNVLPFAPLDVQTLNQILDAKIANHIREFQGEGLQLHIDDSVTQYFVHEAIKKETGARGLESSLVNYLEEIGYEYFGQGKAGIISLQAESGIIKPIVNIQG